MKSPNIFNRYSTNTNRENSENQIKQATHQILNKNISKTFCGVAFCCFRKTNEHKKKNLYASLSPVVLQLDSDESHTVNRSTQISNRVGWELGCSQPNS